MSPPAKATAAVLGGALLALPLLAALAAAALLPGRGAFAAAPSSRATADIPPHLLTLYRRAAHECPGLPWTILAAIGKVETDHARHPTMVSSAGALGPMQFLPATFDQYARPVPPGGQRPPTPWDPVDAVHAAARLLCAHGAADGRDLRRAIWHYNHSDTYVERVLTIAAGYAAPNTAATRAVAFARRQLGTPYRWGGDGPADGGFDCSGLTQAAYAAAGISLPRTAQAQHDATEKVPPGQPLHPGDLLFFGRPGHITHVGLYLGPHRMIHAPHPGATVRTDDHRRPDLVAATRPTNRGTP